MRRPAVARAELFAAVVLCAGCRGQVGTVALSAWAEDTVAEGITTDDGWQVSFDHWVTGFGELTLSSVDKGDVLVEVEGPWVADWAQADALVAVDTVPDVPADRHDLGFSTHPVVSSSAPINGVPSAVLEQMVAEGLVHHIAGAATKDAYSVSFAWGFDQAVTYGPCTNGADGTAGIAVSADATTAAELWFHADHLLWDRLGTEEAGLAFDAIAAADADADGTVTEAELEAVDVITAGYETTGVDVDNLHDFIGFSIAQMAHLNGGGGCTARGYAAHDH